MRFKLVALHSVMVVAAALLACAPSGAPSRSGAAEPRAETRPQKPLVIAMRAEPPSLASKPIVPFTMALYPPLFLFNATLDFRDELEVGRPYLAEALPQLNTDTWQVFPDGRMETRYRLHPNLTWQDGVPLSTEDFVFALQVYSAPQFGIGSSPPIALMEEVLAPDSRTLVIKWRQLYPDAAIISDGWLIGFQPLPRHILEKPFRELDAAAFTALPFWTSEYVGLGPFRVESWEPGAFITARAFDGFVLGKPKIERIEIRFIPDPQTAVANLLAGDVHYVSDYILSVTEGLTLEQQFPQRGGGTVLYSPYSLRGSVVQQRPEHVEAAALLDVGVRRALAYSIDAALAVEVLTDGKGLFSNTLTSPKVPYYGEIERVIQKYRYDPRRAQQLMEEAGYAKSAGGFFSSRDGQVVIFGVASSSGTKNESEAATYVDSLRKAGFDASQRVLPAALIADPEQRALLPGLQVRGGANQVITYTSQQIPTASNRWRGENRGGWSNPSYDRLFEAYNSTLATNERIGHLAQMERIITEDVPYIPHYFSAEVNAHAAGLKGPIARETATTSGTFLYVHTWEWQS